MDISKHGILVERTLALIKPDVINQADEIETIILKNGFTVLQVCANFFLLSSYYLPLFVI